MLVSGSDRIHRSSNKKMVNLFGANGYIGTRYSKKFPVIVQSRDDLIPKSSDILYMISTTHNHHLQTNPYIDIETNLVTLIRVLENVRNLPNPCFNFISSWFVYGATENKADENTVCDPRGFYSITKHTAEKLLIEYCDMYRIAWRILRLSNVVGGIDHTASDNKNALQNIVQNLNSHKPIKLINRGDFFRDYLHIDDACEAIEFIITQSKTNEIYNVGSGQAVKFREVVDRVINLTRSQSTIIEEKGKNNIDCQMDCGKLQKLGWYPKRNLGQVLDEMVKELTVK